MDRKQCESRGARVSKALGVSIDWQQLFDALGAAALQALVVYLEGLVASKSKTALGAPRVACPTSCCADLDCAINQLAIGLAGVVAHRALMCDDMPAPAPAQTGG